MVRIIKEEEKFIAKREIPKDAYNKNKEHFRKSLYCDAYEFIDPADDLFYSFKFMTQDLPNGAWKRRTEHIEIILIIQKHKLDQIGHRLLNSDEEYSV
jgi:hypothetical protein